MDTCTWCEVTGVVLGSGSVFWELPDGTKAIEILNTPTYTCENCGAVYQSDETVKQIEDQLFLISTVDLSKTVDYQDLMKMKRLLKRNYFDFS
ncbi:MULTISPECIES: YokU family protein [Bacillaceae]|uniref:YokU family protein n=1 Tax=Peribacillus huizhouensis TaxID=1501239 RepID=A0ABR6CRP3_9BACI|nr:MULTISPECIES: YokU family protein [Bacillaceae]MBA9027692.1 putative YokU family protein [Peribacillus huizhouensis]